MATNSRVGSRDDTVVNAGYLCTLSRLPFLFLFSVLSFADPAATRSPCGEASWANHLFVLLLACCSVPSLSTAIYILNGFFDPHQTSVWITHLFTTSPNPPGSQSLTANTDQMSCISRKNKEVRIVDNRSDRLMPSLLKTRAALDIHAPHWNLHLSSTSNHRGRNVDSRKWAPLHIAHRYCLCRPPHA